jgi:hypothetical protein
MARALLVHYSRASGLVGHPVGVVEKQRTDAHLPGVGRAVLARGRCGALHVRMSSARHTLHTNLHRDKKQPRYEHLGLRAALLQIPMTELYCATPPPIARSASIRRRAVPQPSARLA